MSKGSVTDRVAFAKVSQIARSHPVWIKLAEELIAANPGLLSGLTPYTTVEEAKLIHRKVCYTYRVAYAKKKANGICYDCASAALPHRVRCLFHNMKAAETSARLKKKKREMK